MSRQERLLFYCSWDYTGLYFHTQPQYNSRIRSYVHFPTVVGFLSGWFLTTEVIPLPFCQDLPNEEVSRMYFLILMCHYPG